MSSVLCNYFSTLQPHYYTTALQLLVKICQLYLSNYKFAVTESALERIPNPEPEEEKEQGEETEGEEGEEDGEAAITQITKELTWPLLSMSFTVADNVMFKLYTFSDVY